MRRIAPLTALLFTCLLSTVAFAADPAKKPNVILILADDLGARELSCYGNKENHTPNLDQFATEGVRFETFFVNPKCTPTRMALMTGQYGFRNGYLGMETKAFVPDKKSPQANIANHFTHAKMMKAAGYKTALVGKWQLSGELPNQVYEAGFDDYRMWAYEKNLPAGVVHPASKKGDEGTARYWQPCIVENGKYIPTTPDDYGPDMFNDYVIDYARKHKEGEPFFIYYTSVLTHSPHDDTPDPAKPGARRAGSFKSSLEYLDHLMGKLFASLKSEGLEENTLVIFVGDNGTGGTGDKGKPTELGARVPCMIRGPGVQRGVVTRALGDVTDFMPTLAEFAGTTLPSTTVFDGKSMAPLLRGQSPTHREWIYAHFDNGRVLRDSRWLLEIDRGDVYKEAFYDCGERRDGIEHYKKVTGSTDPEVVAARARFASILATMPEPKGREGVTGVSAKAQQKLDRAGKQGAEKSKKKDAKPAEE